MKRILLIPVGGTICTEVSEHGTLTVGEGSALRLISDFYASDSFAVGEVEFECADNLMILSENMTVDKWNFILKVCREHMARFSFDGVMIAHGTDTLAYSAALFAMLFSHITVPMIFVSSNRRLGTEGANGGDNFRTAAECILCGVEPNVYAVYKNISDGRTYLHLGSRLRQCASYSEDFFSEGMWDITAENGAQLSEKLCAHAARYPRNKRRSHKAASTLLRPSVLMLSPYVGLDYSAVDYSRFRAVLHGTYHSGTSCAGDSAGSSDSVRYMMDECRRLGTDVYFSPSIPEGEVYDTLRLVRTHGAGRFLYGCTAETAYAKLLIAYSVFDRAEDIEDFICTEQNYEFFAHP